MIANLAKALQNALRSIPSSALNPEAEAHLEQHWLLGSRVLLAFQQLAERQVVLLSPVQQLELTLPILAETFGFPLVFVEQYAPEAERLTIVAAYGVVLPANHEPISMAQQQTLSGTVITTQKLAVWSEKVDPLAIPQLQGIDLFADRFCTIICLPLLYHQEPVGVLTLAHPDYQPIEDYAIHWLKSIAASVAAILAHIQVSQSQQQVQERLDLAALGLRGIVYDLDLQQRQMLRTQGIVNLLGYDEVDVTPSLAWWLNRVHPEDRHELEIFLEQDIQNHREFALTYRVRRSDEQYLMVCDRGIVLRNALGHPIRLVGTITEQTYLLDQLNIDPLDEDPTVALSPPIRS
jgi:PAS domain-containing protein